MDRNGRVLPMGSDAFCVRGCLCGMAGSAGGALRSPSTPLPVSESAVGCGGLLRKSGPLPLASLAAPPGVAIEVDGTRGVRTQRGIPASPPGSAGGTRRDNPGWVIDGQRMGCTCVCWAHVPGSCGKGNSYVASGEVVLDHRGGWHRRLSCIVPSTLGAAAFHRAGLRRLGAGLRATVCVLLGYRRPAWRGACGQQSKPARGWAIGDDSLIPDGSCSTQHGAQLGGSSVA